MSAGFQSRRAPLLLSAYAFLVYAFLYFPIIVLVVYSFNGSGVGGFPPRIGLSTGTASFSRTLLCGTRSLIAC